MIPLPPPHAQAVRSGHVLEVPVAYQGDLMVDHKVYTARPKGVHLLGAEIDVLVSCVVYNYSIWSIWCLWQMEN